MGGKRTEVSPSAKIRSFIRKLNGKKFWFGKLLTELTNRKDENSEQFLDFEGELINNNEKLMLVTRSESRKESDIRILARKLLYTEPFHQYSKSVIRNLVKHSNITGFEAGRVLFDAGDEPLGAYFILSGEVQVGPDERTSPVQRLLEIINKKELHEYIQMLKTEVHGSGCLIGMNEVLFGETRPNRIIVTKNLLCIRFERKYIMVALLPLINRWHEIFEYMREYEIFVHFEFEATRELSTIGKIKRYQAGSLIDATDTSYFLIEGQITVIQRLLVEKYWNNGKFKKRLYHDQNALNYGDNVDSIYMKVCVLNKGAYFGIGDRISKNNLWTANTCLVLYFSKDRLLKYGSPELWNAIRLRLDAFYPSDSEIFKLFQYGRDWLNYKKNVSNQVKRRKGLVTIHDIPISFRWKHMKLKQSFMKNVKMVSMPDYLLGGTDPLEYEISNTFVFDEGGPLREYMFGRLKTSPLHEIENVNMKNIDKRLAVEYETFPSFFYYDVLK